MTEGAPRCVLVSGHMVDAPDRPEPRFPPSEVPRVRREVAGTFDEWRVSAGTTVVSGGARGADLIAAEEGLRYGAAVVLCLALPPAAFDQESVALAGSDWSTRFHAVLEAADVRVLADGAGNVFARTNAWMVSLAQELSGGAPHVVLVWDGRRGDGPGGTQDVAVRLGLHAGHPRLRVIDPRPGRGRSEGPVGSGR